MRADKFVRYFHLISRAIAANCDSRSLEWEQKRRMNIWKITYLCFVQEVCIIQKYNAYRNGPRGSTQAIHFALCVHRRSHSIWTKKKINCVRPLCAENYRLQFDGRTGNHTRDAPPNVHYFVVGPELNGNIPQIRFPNCFPKIEIVIILARNAELNQKNVESRLTR